MEESLKSKHWPNLGQIWASARATINNVNKFHLLWEANNPRASICTKQKVTGKVTPECKMSVKRGIHSYFYNHNRSDSGEKHEQILQLLLWVNITVYADQNLITKAG